MYKVKIINNLPYINYKNELIKLDIDKVFHNDVISYPDINIIKSPTRNNYLVGIISTSQTVKFGKNIYQLTPLNNNLPKFTITYKGKTKGKLVIRFKYIHFNNKLPHAELIQIIGNYNDNIIIPTLKFLYDINPKSIKKINNISNTNIKRIDLTNLFTFSIDPKGSTDIDDAISFHNDLLYIHIANPIEYISKETLLYLMKHNFSTLYHYETNHLFGNDITYKSSLLEKEKRPAISFKYRIIDNKLVFEDYFCSEIINNHNYTYSDKNIHIDKLNKLISYDTHYCIEYLMKLVNCQMGIITNGPYRIKLSEFDKAQYSYENDYHCDLKLKKYTHFTSPIRRIIDTINHYNICFDDKIIIDLEKLNELDNNTRKFHKNVELLMNIEDLEDGDYYGEVIRYNENKISLRFDFGIFSIKLYHYILKFLYKVKIQNNILYINEKEIRIGDVLKCNIKKKIGFLPKERLIIKLI